MSWYDKIMQGVSRPPAARGNTANYGQGALAHTYAPVDTSPLWNPAAPVGISDSSGTRGMSQRYIGRDLVPAESERKGRADYYANQTDTLMSDPNRIAGLFGGAYQRAGEAISAPALRDFTKTQAGLQGSIASRFGGNASSVEGGALANAGDIFSRNLTEALAGLVPQQVGQGLQYTGQVAAQGQAARDEEDRIRQMILSAIGGVGEKPKSGFANFAGGLLGTAAGALTGGLATGKIGPMSGV